jgi:tetratricopeptide (TPR) repeat protein
MPNYDIKLKLNEIRILKKSGHVYSDEEEIQIIKKFVLDFYMNFIDDETFAVKIRDFVLLFFDMYDVLKKVLYLICNEENLDQTIKFYSFYSLYTLFRRNQNFKAIGELIDKYKKDFSTEPRLDIVLSQYYKFTAEDSSKSDLQKAVNYAERAMNNPNLINMNGVKANYAEIIGVSITNKIQLSENDINESDKEKIARAEEAIDDEIKRKNDYGKYYYLRAKLYILQKRYDEALQNINNAIEFEDKSGTDAHLRIPEYIGFRYEVKQRIKEEYLEEKIEGLVKKSQYLDDELNENKTKIIEYITFFSGIIAFIVSTIQISLTAKTFGAYVGLLLVMSSLLIFFFHFIYADYPWA